MTATSQHLAEATVLIEVAVKNRQQVAATTDPTALVVKIRQRVESTATLDRQALVATNCRTGLTKPLELPVLEGLADRSTELLASEEVSEPAATID